MMRGFGSALHWEIESSRLFPGSQRPEMMLFALCSDERLRLKSTKGCSFKFFTFAITPRRHSSEIELEPSDLEFDDSLAIYQIAHFVLAHCL